MSALKVVGGILALAAGALVLLLDLVLLGFPLYSLFPSTGGFGMQATLVSMEPAILYVQLIVSIVAMGGGILGLIGKRAGGILALISGIVWLLGGFLFYYVLILTPLSALFAWTNLPGPLSIGGSYALLITFEAVLAVVGGILMLPKGKD